MAPPATSRAWVFTARGPPASALTLTTERQTPTLPPALPLPKDAPTPEEWILVKTAYAGLNPAGLFHIALLPAFARAKTSIPELDMSGTVLDVWAPDAPKDAPDASPRFKAGDRVAAFLPVSHMWPTGTGALAEYVAIPAKYAVPVPAGVSLRDAGALPLASLCAKAIVDGAKLKEGGRVLVNAAAGGIGSFAIQMARNAVGSSGFVVGICSGRNVELVKSLGADEVIDYTTFNPLSAELKKRYASAPFDAIIDAIGIQDIYANCTPYLTEDGVYSAIGLKAASFSLLSFVGVFARMQVNALWPRATWLGGTGRTWKGATVMGATVEEMAAMVALLAEGKMRVVVGSEWRMEDVQEGYKILQSGRTTGKIVIKIDEEAE